MGFPFMLILVVLNQAFNHVADASKASLTAELQWNICEDASSFFKKTKIPFVLEKTQTVYLFESNDLNLYSGQATIRLRRSSQKTELTAKQKFGPKLNPDLLDLYECEFDVHDRSKELSCQSSKNLSEDSFQHLLKGKISLFDILDREQLNLLSKNDLVQYLHLTRLLGPIIETNWSAKTNSNNYDFKRSQTPIGSLYYEFSFRVESINWQETNEEMYSFLKQKNVILCKNQEGQRRKIIEDLFNHTTY